MALKIIVIMHLLSLTLAQDCYQKDHDVGGGSNSCGYMDIIAIIAAAGEEKYDWYEGYFMTVPAIDIDSPAKCQAHCEATPGCKFFAYSEPDPYADCTLKTGYHGKADCTPLYEEGTGYHSGPSMCPSCIKLEKDVGSGKFNPCGYMDNIALYAKANVTKQSWWKGYYPVLDDVVTWTIERCKGLCFSTPTCDYWHMGDENCYLKADYTADQKMKNDGCVPLYAPFEVERDYVNKTFKDASGPKMCVTASKSVSCGTLKEVYKSGNCCGMSGDKMVPM